MTTPADERARLARTAEMLGLTLPQFADFLERRIGDPRLARHQALIRQDLALLRAVPKEVADVR